MGLSGDSSEIKNIWAIGRNYADHAREMGVQPQPAGDPMIFLKAGSSVVPSGQKIMLPKWSNDIHHEIELAVRLDQNFKPAWFTVALDLTARDKQAEAKKSGQPWTLAKSFTHSCPLGKWLPVTDQVNLQKLQLVLTVNSQIRQSGTTGDMLHSIEKTIGFVRAHFPVVPGDVLLTGTPAGVAALKSGDVVVAEIEGYIKENWQVG